MLVCLCGGGVCRVCACDCGQDQGGGCDIFCHGAGGILAGADRDDLAARDKADGGLQPDDAGNGCRAGDGAVGFGADGGVHHAGGDCGTRSGRGAARVAVKRVRVAGLAADGAPAGNGGAAAEIGPFGEIGFAQDDGARRAQSGNDGGVAQGDIGGKREAAGGRWKICGFDIVFDEDGHAKKRATHFALAIERSCLVAGRRVERKHSVDFWIQCLDSGNRCLRLLFGSLCRCRRRKR